jgi:hypothetical protein
VLDEISRDLAEALIGGNDIIILANQLIERRRLVGVEFDFLDFLGNAALRSRRATPSFSPRFDNLGEIGQRPGQAIDLVDDDAYRREALQGRSIVPPDRAPSSYISGSAIQRGVAIASSCKDTLTTSWHKSCLISL